LYIYCVYGNATALSFCQGIYGIIGGVNKWGSFIRQVLHHHMYDRSFIRQVYTNQKAQLKTISPTTKPIMCFSFFFLYLHCIYIEHLRQQVIFLLFKVGMIGRRGVVACNRTIVVVVIAGVVCLVCNPQRLQQFSLFGQPLDRQALLLAYGLELLDRHLLVGRCLLIDLLYLLLSLLLFWFCLERRRRLDRRCDGNGCVFD